MRRLLVVEDEESLRHGMVRALGKLADVEVTGAGSVREALAYIDATPPDALISDLDLPDRLGAELLGELEKRGLPIPVTFVSAHTVNLGARIPRSARIRVVDKPISLERPARARTLDVGTAGFGVASSLWTRGLPSARLSGSALGRHHASQSSERCKLRCTRGGLAR